MQSSCNKILTMAICYGVEFPNNWNQFQVELFLFYWGNQLAENPYLHPAVDGTDRPRVSKIPYDGEGRFQHFQNIVKAIFPTSFQWSEWATKQARALCENKSTGICGAGGSGKSTVSAMYALIWWLCAPHCSAVLIASTTIDAAKKRIWKNIRQYYTELVKKIGADFGTRLMGNPKPHIRSPDITVGGKKVPDSAHGIYVVAVAKGEEQKGIDNLKGFHPQRLLMIGDETDSIGQAVVEVGANQEIGAIEYQTIWLGNDPSMFNPLGKLMEPEKGKAVGLQHIEWTSTSGVHCLRFDAYDSPNLRGKVRWNGIVTQENIDSIIAKYGPNSPQVWIMLRGIHPPEGADSTVVSEALLMRYNCAQGVTWKKNYILSSVLDPAFGGDRCVYRTMARGNDMQDKMKCLLLEKIVIPIVANDPRNPAEFQIAAKVIEFNKARGIPPEEYSGDSTGTGRGVTAVIQREWSPNINLCEFGGRPSDMPIGDENPKPASEEYDRKVTELWFSIREFVQADMIRGLDPETAMELCQRRFEIRNKKTRIETKEEMKERGLESPDFADALAVYIHMIREKGVYASVITDVKTVHVQDYARKLQEHDLDGQEWTYSPAMDDMQPAGAGSYMD